MGSENIQCRLDRCLISSSFLDKFSPITVTHLARFGSDHAALRIVLEEKATHDGMKKKHIFRFEEA